MKRRNFLKITSSGLILPTAVSLPEKHIEQTLLKSNLNTEIAVIGAGVFGLWTAFYLQQLGAKVTLIDAYGVGNSRGSSGGESRIIRAEYGTRFMYTKMNIRAHDLLKSWEEKWGVKLIYSTGRLTLGSEEYRKEALQVQKDLKQFGIESEVLNQTELKYRYPQINLSDVHTGLYFSGGAGGSTVLARASCHAVGDAFIKGGGKLVIGKATPDKVVSGKMPSIDIGNGQKIVADTFLFACGPWMSKVFPEVFAHRLKVFRREVFFVGSPAGDTRYAYPNFPVWVDGNMYGMPDLLGQGFKIAPFPDYNTIDPDTDERMVNPYMTKQVHDYVGRRFPGLDKQPIVRTKVCQLTFSKDEHFIIDKHPEIENIWFMGAGSGHGFKHGPALGEYVAKRIFNNEKNVELDESFRLEKQ